MPTIYVRSTDGNNADDGSTWALAKQTLAGAAAIDAAGDTIYVSDNHAESTAGAVSIALAGTPASPVNVICGDDAAEPPTAGATTGTVTTTGANSITITGTAYFYGLTFDVGTGASSAAFICANGATQTFDTCNIRLVNTGTTTARINMGADTQGGNCILINSGIRFAAAGQGIGIAGASFYWRGGSLLSGGTSPSTLITDNGGSTIRGGEVLIEGVDLSNLSSSANLVQGTSASNSTGRIVFRNCKLPASWSGSPLTGTIRQNQRVELWNCDNADTNYRLWIQSYQGSIKHETTIVRTGGASDGTTTFSWNMTSTANVSYTSYPLVSPDLYRWNDTTGSAITVTVEIVTDNVTLTDAECWLDVQYLGTSGFPLALFVDDAKTDWFASAANQTSSSETWTTTGLATPVKQKLAVTFTPQEKGFIIATVRLAKASTTVYVDPELTVT